MLTIIDYNAGNIRSVLRACAEIGVKAVITGDPLKIESASRVIFPGVGAAPAAMANLKHNGLDQALKKAFDRGIPILGICIGTQIILEESEEGPTQCLGLVPGKTVRFKIDNPSFKIPHMGWNGLNIVQSHPLLDGIKSGDEFYFVHSYYPQPAENKYIYALSNYADDFCVALGHKNLFATQFHPEKSGRLGLELLRRFAQWDGTVKGEK